MNIIYQDNKSTIILENSGKKSSIKKTRDFKIRYLLLIDQVDKCNFSIEYFSNLEMIGDFILKPLQGKLFQRFYKLIMGH